MLSTGVEKIVDNLDGLLPASEKAPQPVTKSHKTNEIMARRHESVDNRAYCPQVIASSVKSGTLCGRQRSVVDGPRAVML